jgi:hypothetical protein
VEETTGNDEPNKDVEERGREEDDDSPEISKSDKLRLLVFYAGFILDDKNTLCNGCFLTGLSVLFRVFK